MRYLEKKVDGRQKLYEKNESSGWNVEAEWKQRREFELWNHM